MLQIKQIFQHRHLVKVAYQKDKIQIILKILRQKFCNINGLIEL